ncbi:unnamed protein product, partial [Didymodactylos carnosus]
DRKEPIQLTIQRLIDALHSENIDVPHNLLYREKTGHDGAGSMSIYRPLLLIAEKENHELLHFVNEQFEYREKSLKEIGLTFQYKNETYNVKIEIEASMKDMKVDESGLGVAECLMCSTKQEDWKDTKKISDPDLFDINRTAKKGP